MSTESLEHQADTHVEAASHGPSDATYVKIAAILAGLTALEVTTYFVDFGPLFLPTLLTLMTIKFLTVVAYFRRIVLARSVTPGTSASWSTPTQLTGSVSTHTYASNSKARRSSATTAIRRPRVQTRAGMPQDRAANLLGWRRPAHSTR